MTGQSVTRMTQVTLMTQVTQPDYNADCISQVKFLPVMLRNLAASAISESLAI